MLASLPRYAKASARDLEEVRLRRLKRVLHHAYDHVPYHRDLFDRAGIRPEDVRSFADLQRVPVTTRADLQRTPLEQLTADNVRGQVNQARTGGSTGVAITIVWAPREGWIDRFNTARSLWLNGWHPPQSILKLFWRFPTAPYWSRKLGQIGLHMPNLRVGEPPEEQLARMREMRPERNSMRRAFRERKQESGPGRTSMAEGEN